MDQNTKETAHQMFLMALEKSVVAKELHGSEYFNDSISRSYYAAFHLLGLVMFIHGKSFSSHSQLIGAFNKDLVATGKIIRDAGKAVNRLFEQRQSADYDFFERASKEESAMAIQDTELVFTTILDYVRSTFGLEFR